MAKEDFLKQIIGHEDAVNYITSTEQIDESKQVIMIESGNENLFLETLSRLNDRSERIIFLKNFEIFKSATIQETISHSNLIISGDIDQSAAKDLILKKEFQTIIQFSKPLSPLPVPCPELEKYTGFLWQNKKQGLVSIIPK